VRVTRVSPTSGDRRPLLKALFPGQVEWDSHPINQFIARQKVPNIYLGSLFFNLFSKTKRFENAIVRSYLLQKWMYRAFIEVSNCGR
jgi:hypothetical protein